MGCNVDASCCVNEVTKRPAPMAAVKLVKTSASKKVPRVNNG